MPFVDDFTRASYPELLEVSANWSKSGGSGTLTVTSAGVLTSSTAGTDALFPSPDEGNALHFGRMVRTSIADSFMFPIAINATDENNYIGLRLNSGQIQVYTVIAGAFSSKFTQAITWGVDDSAELRRISSTELELYHNDILITTGASLQGITTFNTITTQGMVVRSDAAASVFSGYSTGLSVPAAVITGQPASVKPSGSYQLDGTGFGTTFETAVLLFDTIDISAYITSVTDIAVSFDIPAALALLFDRTTGYAFDFTADDASNDVSAAVPYIPVTGNDYIDITDVSNAGTDVSMYYGHSSGTPAIGQQFEFQLKSTSELADFAILADSSYSISAITVDNTVQARVIDTDGSLGAFKTFTLLAAGGGAYIESGIVRDVVRDVVSDVVFNPNDTKLLGFKNV